MKDVDVLESQLANLDDKILAIDQEIMDTFNDLNK